jgi:hypothetical protein
MEDIGLAKAIESGKTGQYIDLSRIPEKTSLLESNELNENSY